jgi:hypothetical protein
LRLRYSYKRLFETVLSGLLDFGVFEKDAPAPQNTTRTAFDGALHEAYVGLYVRHFDLRVGQQRIAWGRADAFPINDVINARDLRNQFLIEPDALHLPTPALRLDADFGFGYLQAVVAPFFIQDRFDLYGANWSVIQPGAPAPYRALFGLASTLANDNLHDALQPLLGATDPPPADFSATQAGLRLQFNLRHVDLGLSYHYGYDRTPRLRIDPGFAQTIAMTDFATAGLPGALMPYLAALQMGQRPIVSDYVRRHHAGLELGTTVGPVVLRAEAAYDSSMVFAGADLNGVVLPSVQAVVGAEYQPGALGRAVIVEGWYQHLFDAPADGALLLARQDMYGVAALFRWSFFRDHLELDVRGLVGLNPFYYAVRPQIGYKWRGLAIRAGALLLDGDDHSFGSYYHRNTSVYLIVRYAF